VYFIFDGADLMKHSSMVGMLLY